MLKQTVMRTLIEILDGFMKSSHYNICYENSFGTFVYINPLVSYQKTENS